MTDERPPLRHCELLADPIPKGKAEIRFTRLANPSRSAMRYDLRIWIVDKLTGEWRPCGRGITVAADKVAALRDMLVVGCARAGLADD